VQKQMTKGELVAVADHWDAIAASDEAMAAWNRDHGRDLSKPGESPGDHKAATARRTAKSIRLEAETGKVHCSMCLGAHAEHEHRFIG
jgi:hypothetical protein